MCIGTCQQRYNLEYDKTNSKWSSSSCAEGLSRSYSTQSQNTTTAHAPTTAHDTTATACDFNGTGPETKPMRANEFVTEKKRMKKLKELTFMGMSPCTKDCSGHRAGYKWSKARGGVSTASWSNSFNKGAEIARAGY